jgi:hypothetical protein
MNLWNSSLTVQVADRPSKNAISVGGAILVVPSAIEESQRLRGGYISVPSLFSCSASCPPSTRLRTRSLIKLMIYICSFHLAPCNCTVFSDAEEVETGPAPRDSTGRSIPKEAPHSWRLTSKNAKIIKDVQNSKGMSAP